MKTRALVMVLAGLGGLAGAAPAIVACGSGQDDAAATGADLSSADAGADADTPITLAQKRLVGAWLPTSGGSGELALVIHGSTRIAMSRDLPHKAVSSEDRQDVDRTSATITVQSVAADGAGKLDTASSLIVDHVSFRQLEEYSFEFGSQGGKDTLTLTETSIQLVPLFPPKDGGAPLPDAGTPALRPPIHLTRAASWCARPRSAANASGDCNTEFDEGLFKPNDMPPECEGNEDLCMSCEAHACKTHSVSSCELARFTCQPSVEACEFQNGQPTGQVAKIDPKGKPIDCNGSHRGGNTVCCEDLGGSGDDDDDDDDENDH
jgi:hypothetical protein